MTETKDLGILHFARPGAGIDKGTGGSLTAALMEVHP